MILDLDELFRFASRLARDGPGEAEFRSSISRAYYCCLLTVRDTLWGIDAEHLPRTTRRRGGRATQNQGERGSHDVIIGGIRRSPGIDQGVAKKLFDLMQHFKQMRVQADYFRNSDHEKTARLMEHEGVDTWEGLADASATLASTLLPELRGLAALQTGHR